MSETKLKRLKTSLVNTRRTIANKFRKLQKERVEKENRLKEKYAPITDSLDKIINTKEKFASFKNDQLNDLDISEEMDLEYRPIENYRERAQKRKRSNDEVMHNKKRRTLRQNRSSERDGTANENVINVAQKRKRSNDEVTHDKKRRTLEQIRASERDGASNENVINEVLDDMNEVPRNKRSREDETLDVGAMRKKRRLVRESIRSSHRINEAINASSKYGKKIKKINLFDGRLKISTRRKNQRALGNDMNRHASTASKRVVVSPEDYDQNGNFVGLATKRRRITIPPEKIVEGKYRRKVRQLNSRPQKKSFATYGEGLEHNFIPYTENIVYEYYDDPNELCERLKLLLSSKSAGNTNHDQEINSIIEELRERNIIV